MPTERLVRYIVTNGVCMAKNCKRRARILGVEVAEGFKIGFRGGHDERGAKIESGIVDLPASDRDQIHAQGISAFSVALSCRDQNGQRFGRRVNPGTATGPVSRHWFWCRHVKGRKRAV